MSKRLTAAAAALLALALAGCGSDRAATTKAGATSPATSPSAMQKDPTASAMEKDDDQAMGDEAALATGGAWIDQADYEADKAAYHAAGDVVLFFNATWCPTCKETVKNLDVDGTPAGLTVVGVDYDSNADLKRYYGVTVQHTFVQVDADGEQLAKFTGSTTGEQIASRTA